MPCSNKGGIDISLPSFLYSYFPLKKIFFFKIASTLSRNVQLTYEGRRRESTLLGTKGNSGVSSIRYKTKISKNRHSLSFAVYTFCRAPSPHAAESKGSLQFPVELNMFFFNAFLVDASDRIT